MDQACYYRISIKGIVIDDAGRILLSREENGLWELLGGGLEHGENPTEALIREVKEEAGLVVTSISAQPKYFTTSPRRNTDPQTYIANVIYEISLKDLEFTPSDECQELRFVSIEEMRHLPLFPNVTALLEILEAETASRTR